MERTFTVSFYLNPIEMVLNYYLLNALTTLKIILIRKIDKWFITIKKIVTVCR